VSWQPLLLMVRALPLRRYKLGAKMDCWPPIVETRWQPLSLLCLNGSKLRRRPLPSVRTSGRICKRSSGTGLRLRPWFRYVRHRIDWGVADLLLPGHLSECYACRDGDRPGLCCTSYGEDVGRRGEGCEGLVAGLHTGSRAPVP
jgi:hypothetical protein